MSQRRVRAFGIGDVVIVQRDVAVAVDIHVRVVINFADRVVRAEGHRSNLVDLGLRDTAITIPVGHVMMARLAVRIVSHALD